MLFDINDRLAQLRAVMSEKNLDAIIVPSSDPHQSEYVAAHWQERTYLSGFTGSAGLLVITHDHAGLWTDSRYFIQAQQELEGTSFTLHKMTNQFGYDYIDFLKENLIMGSDVAINGWMFSKASVDTFTTLLGESQISLHYRHDLISQIWTDRPPLSKNPIIVHDLTFAGENVPSKLTNIRSKMIAKKADYHLITTLDDLAWTYNIRGSDVDFNPVAIAYAVVGKDDAHIFIDQDKLTSESVSYFGDNLIQIHPYGDIIAFLNHLPSQDTMMVDPNQCNQTVYEAINSSKIHQSSLPKVLKAIKNNIEIGHIRETMKKDGAALAHTFYWLEDGLKNGKTILETDFAKKLIASRAHQEHYVGESFSAIIGYNSNGAIIHYRPEESTCKRIQNDGILLADSGGQYLDGTTDITRTIALGAPTEDQKKHYTLILKGMVSLSMAKFPKGTTGAQLDTLARQYLWSEGLNYLHGTGHGVGFFLNVHESPQGFGPTHSERGKTAHLPGMLSSNEPGYYIEGQYGMRIENLIVCQESDLPDFLSFETLTLYPLDHRLIDTKCLDQKEIKWLNDYHKQVWEGVSPLLNGEIKTWFEEKCKPI